MKRAKRERETSARFDFARRMQDGVKPGAEGSLSEAEQTLLDQLRRMRKEEEERRRRELKAHTAAEDKPGTRRPVAPGRTFQDRAH